MKLLFDQNLSPRLAYLLSDLHPDSTHTHHIGFDEDEDSAIWDYAIANDFAIVTKDRDFNLRSLVDGHPPKVIWITLGNCPTSEVEIILRVNHLEVVAFLSDPKRSVIPLGRDSIALS